MIDFKKELNAAQYKVVTEADGPCLVLAGAGSGKTRTLVYRVAYLLEHGVDPSRIMLLTFTNKAAHEMLSRVAELVKDDQKSKKIWGGTFHHVAHRILRKMGSAVGLKNNFTILDREDSKDVVKRALKEITGGDTSKRVPQAGVFLETISYAGNAGISLENSLAMKYPEQIRFTELFISVAHRYEEKKKLSNAVDFDDLLLLWRRLLSIPRMREKLAAQWDYILVDEYQDTNIVQDDIVKQLASKSRNLLVVGDDAQSIYSFRAANIQNILQFPKQFPDAKIFKLEENYRSTPEILEVANETIRKNTNQFKKNLFTENENFLKPEVLILQDPPEEAATIAERIIAIEDEGVPLSSIAVLFRAAFQSQPLELELNRRGIPYEMRGGLRFFERAHIKDALAYLRLLGNHQDESAWFRTLVLQEGIGDQTAQKILEVARVNESLAGALGVTIALSTSAMRGWQNFSKIIGGLLAEQGGTVGQLIRNLLKSYGQYLELHYPDFKDRLDDLEQLAIFADRYPDLETFLAETSLQEAYAVRGNTGEKHEPGIVLSTIHQAKGLEWHTVFIMQLTSNSLPHPRAMSEEGGLEEERRLFYVAVTRAQRRLYLTYPVSASQFSLSINQPSQFLMELRRDLLAGDLESIEEEAYSDDDETGPRQFLPPIHRL